MSKTTRMPILVIIPLRILHSDSRFPAPSA
jgi:hypothetical protein